ncbi:MAG: LD-carboxypeptidase [Chitinophagaceae bacterium]|nr:LD-carboxypeptidase [Chitinophagaceae bacterium]
MIIPDYLKPGDTIGLVCPAGYMAADKTEDCIRTLREWGYEVITGKTVGGASKNYFSGTDEERLSDFQQMLDDDTIKAILCARGGYGTGRIIERIRFKRFKKNPKWIIGYSDITVLHCHLLSNYKVASLHAPMAAAFQDGGHRSPYVLSLKEALEGKPADYVAEAHPTNRKGKAKGRLAGGNLALLAHLTGTSSDIKTEGRILFLEDVGEYLYNIDRMMHQLKRSGKLENLAGLIFGIFSDNKDTDRPFGQTVQDILWNIVKEYDYPVCFEFPVSHTEKNYALKIGVEYELNVGDTNVRLREAVKK